jgi:UDP-N-acetylmuramate dehydrogenase
MKNLKIQKQYDLSRLSSFKIGGKADFFCTPSTISEIFKAFNFASLNNLNIIFIGGSTNILFSDNGLNGLVISTAKLNRYQISGNIVTAEAGINIKKLNEKIIKHSLKGLEFTGGLPGSIGGAVFMNARAYGNEMSDVVKSVSAIKRNCDIIILQKEELTFSYKNSYFKENPDIFIYSITLELEKGDIKEIKNNYNKNIFDRTSKEQFIYPSAGCIFKNNYEKGIIAGKIIDELGLKGTRIGDAEVFEKHANFIINKDKAKAEDVKKLIEQIEKKVYQEKKIKLDREIILLGF